MLQRVLWLPGNEMKELLPPTDLTHCLTLADVTLAGYLILFLLLVTSQPASSTSAEVTHSPTSDDAILTQCCVWGCHSCFHKSADLIYSPLRLMTSFIHTSGEVIHTSVICWYHSLSITSDDAIHIPDDAIHTLHMMTSLSPMSGDVTPFLLYLMSSV